jgi:hypothetical protein
MAIGDRADMLARMRETFPAGWVPDVAPNLDRLLTGPAELYAKSWDQLQAVYGQDRLATASGEQLNLLANDYFQGRLYRKDAETDTHFRGRISRELLRERATRAGLIAELLSLTGVKPDIFEPGNTTDTGGYDIGGCGYDVAGGYGSMDMPFQVLITAYRPASGGVPGVDGYDGSIGGYDMGAIEYISDADFQGIPDQEIRDAVLDCMPISHIALLHIANVPPNGDRLSVNFILDHSRMV